LAIAARQSIEAGKSRAAVSEGSGTVKYVSVLTPPLLVCAVFLIAVIAFLRHEMGGRRSDRRDPSAAEEFPDDDPIRSRDPDTQPQGHDTSDLADDK
jgi:hypothetical protein